MGTGIGHTESDGKWARATAKGQGGWRVWVFGEGGGWADTVYGVWEEAEEEREVAEASMGVRCEVRWWSAV
jgi:hypothetical protein